MKEYRICKYDSRDGRNAETVCMHYTTPDRYTHGGKPATLATMNNIYISLFTIGDTAAIATAK